MPDAIVVANPAAANGRLGRRWKDVARTIAARLPPHHVELTQGAGHAEAIVRQVLRTGAKLVVAVGGDGTFHEVVNGFFEPEGGVPISPDARLGLVPFGTGGDLRRTLGIPNDVARAASIVAAARARPVDVGLAVYRGRDGREHRRHFVNIAEFGSGGAVVDRVNRSSKILGGKLTFLLGVLATLPRYRNTRVRWRAESSEGEAVVNNFVVANGRHFGGGLTPAPKAEMDDGRLDVVVIGDIGFLEGARKLGALRRGEHLGHPKIQSFRTASLEVDCLEPALLDLDGELVGESPTRFELRPLALRVIA